MEKKVNYHFLTASTLYYNENSFQELIDEQKRFGGYVYWHIGNHKIYQIIVVGSYFSVRS